LTSTAPNAHRLHRSAVCPLVDTAQHLGDNGKSEFDLQLSPLSGQTIYGRLTSRGGRLMKTTVERLPEFPARVKLEVEVGPERVEEAVERAYRRAARSLRIPGFRPGR